MKSSARLKILVYALSFLQYYIYWEGRLRTSNHFSSKLKANL
jgi:hypothetical protein